MTIQKTRLQHTRELSPVKEAYRRASCTDESGKVASVGFPDLQACGVKPAIADVTGNIEPGKEKILIA